MPERSEIDWLTAVRIELKWYQRQHSETTLELDDIYTFSEGSLAGQFPDNDHIRAKIRQVLQRLSKRGEIEFIDGEGTYRILELELEGPLRAYAHGSRHSRQEPVGPASGEAGSDKVSRKQIERERSELTEAVTAAPQLTENTEYVETRRRARNHAFRELVRDAYDRTCAVCGSQRESPSGDPEVEAAHIFPKSEGGSDDIRNGVALCKLHHWAFDSGWLSFTDDHEIVVTDAPGMNGYHEFKQLEGQPLRLPDDEDTHPHPVFLEQRRELQGRE